MPNVCHFLRKSSQLRASFINNQISSHIRYNPYLIYRLNVVKNYDGGYADFKRSMTRLDLSDSESLFEQILYKGPKLLSGRQVKRVNDFLKSNDIRIAHFHYGTDCGTFYPLTKNLNVPIVVSFYGYDISSFPKYLAGYGKTYLQNRVFKRADKILAMSPDMKTDLLKAGCPLEKIILHYYGTDCTIFKHEHSYADKEIITILTLSNLCQKKGHIFQLKALKSLLEKGIENFRFRIAGSGELDQELKLFVNTNALNDYVTFTGPLKYGSPEMMEEYRNADIFLHPSVVAPNGDKEGIPGTIIEAMAAGLPVVSTFHAGIPYVIKNEETGLLVNEWDIDGLSFAINGLIASRIKREKFGRSAQQYAMDYLNLHEKEKELENIYDSLINNAK
ncbi:D-inositol-3-phosphate glycosyltransferase [anaerobic digester metagenome]